MACEWASAVLGESRTPRIEVAGPAAAEPTRSAGTCNRRSTSRSTSTRSPSPTTVSRCPSTICPHDEGGVDPDAAARGVSAVGNHPPGLRQRRPLRRIDGGGAALAGDDVAAGVASYVSTAGGVTGPSPRPHGPVRRRQGPTSSTSPATPTGTSSSSTRASRALSARSRSAGSCALCPRQTSRQLSSYSTPASRRPRDAGPELSTLMVAPGVDPSALRLVLGPEFSSVSSARYQSPDAASGETGVPSGAGGDPVCPSSVLRR